MDGIKMMVAAVCEGGKKHNMQISFNGEQCYVVVVIITSPHLKCLCDAGN